MDYFGRMVKKVRGKKEVCKSHKTIFTIEHISFYFILFIFIGFVLGSFKTPKKVVYLNDSSE